MNIETDNTSLTIQASRAVDRRNNYWAAVRQAGKEARLSFTEAIADFTAYEDDSGGSTAPERAFSNFTRSIYAPFGLNKKAIEDRQNSRDTLDIILLDALRLVEGTAAAIMREGMAKRRSRAEIKAAVKALAQEVAATVQRMGGGNYFGDEVIQ